MKAAERKGRAKSEPRYGKRSQRSIPVTQWLSRALEHGSESGCNVASRSASQHLRESNALLLHLYLCPCLHVGGAGNDGRGLCCVHKRLPQIHIFSSVVTVVPSSAHLPTRQRRTSVLDHKGSSVWSTVGL